MKRTRSGNDPDGSTRAADPDVPAVAEEDLPVQRKRRGRRIVALSGLGALVLIGASAAAGFLIVHQLMAGISRVRAGGLVTSRGGQTFLITGAGFGPTGAAAPASAAQFSGLIVMMHLNAGKKAGAVVSLPPLAVVPVPGKGRMELENALAYGGPTLLVRTVEQLTHVPINHYARLDFDHVSKVIDALGGIDISMAEPSVSYGHKFRAGVNQLNGLTAIYYVRAGSVTNADRILRQQNLMRAILSKVASRHMLADPVKMYHTVDALTGMMTVDSDFTGSELMSLARELSSLSGKSGTFVTAPSHQAGKQSLLDGPACGQLWQAIRHDSVAAFARKDPYTLTPAVVP